MLAIVLPLSAASEATTSPNPLLPGTAEIIFGLVFLILLAVAFAKLVVPRFEKAYADRTAAIEGGMNEAKRAQAEAKAALEKYNKQLAEARQEAAKIREEAREQGALIIAEMRENATAEADRIVTHARTQIDAERAQAVTALRREVGTMATQLASRIVGESLEEEARQRRTVERFLAELESQESAGNKPPQSVGTDG
jgi:F-type H+-transporting ATPase subunit b